MFKSKTNVGDYHGEMNAVNFETWLKEKLFPNLQKPSIIILDNASYHSRQSERLPIKSWTKENMRNWLNTKQIKFPDTAKKADLWTLISQVPKHKSYAVENLINEAGHQVLRLPPYHCQYNAIEMVWSQAKRFYDKHIVETNNILGTWEVALANISQENWRNYVCHTDKVIKEAWDKELNIIAPNNPIVINVDSDCDFSDSTDDDE